MQYQVLLFGIDGVLCNTEALHRIAWKQICDSLSISYPIEADSFTTSHSRIKVLEYLLASSGLDLSNAEKSLILEEKDDIYQQLLLNSLNEAAIVPGVIDMLTQIRSMPYKTAAVTPSKNAISLLKRLKLYRYFDVVVDGNDLNEEQSEEKLFECACSELCVSPQNALVIDAHADRIPLLLKSGFSCISLAQTKIPGAERIFSFDELLKFIIA